MTQLIVGTVSFPWQLGEVNCKIFCFVSITLRKKNTPKENFALGDYSFSTYAKYSEKLKFITP